MAAKSTSIVKYSPTSSDLLHMRHCVSLNLVKLSLSRKAEYKDEFLIARYDDSVNPPRTFHFLKNFSLPETPANRQVYTEYDGLKKIFEIYKEFYMRNTNIPEEVIQEDLEKTKVKELIVKEKPIKKTKKQLEEERLLNFPNRQIDLLEMIDDCERENENSQR